MVKKTKEILFVILVVLSVIAAWLIGGFRHNASVGLVLETVMPKAHQFEKAPSDVYIGLVGQGDSTRPVGYVGLCSATGSLGHVEVATGFDTTGLITSVALVNPINTSEVSPQELNQMLRQFVGKHYNESFTEARQAQMTPGIQMVWQGLVDMVQQSGRNVATVQGQVVNSGYKSRRWFGFPEFILILLYAVGYLAYRERSPHQGRLHWAVLVSSVFFLGFWLKHPMSLVHINSFLMGYWPSWQTHLYWYLLIGGVLVPIIVTGRSFYCSHVCPFGATQKILKAMGPKPLNLPERVDLTLRWLQRCLVWLAVICALIVRNPAVVRYDVPGTFFGLAGVTWQFVLLAVVLIASLMITRPWCNYLCPIRAITDFINTLRRVVGIAKDETKSSTGMTSPCGS